MELLRCTTQIHVCTMNDVWNYSGVPHKYMYVRWTMYGIIQVYHTNTCMYDERCMELFRCTAQIHVYTIKDIWKHTYFYQWHLLFFLVKRTLYVIWNMYNIYKSFSPFQQNINKISIQISHSNFTLFKVKYGSLSLSF